MVGAMLVYSWPNVGVCWLIVGTLLGDGWHNVGLWFVIVGAMSGDSWRLVGFWLAANVYSTSKVTLAYQICCCWANIKPTVGFWLTNG